MQSQELKDYHKEMDRHYAEISMKNKRISNAVESMFGKKYWEDICDCMETCEASTFPFEIVRKPIGDEQSEDWGSFNKTWVDQQSVGYSGDSFEGTVCIPLDGKRWFKFHYSM